MGRSTVQKLTGQSTQEEGRTGSGTKGVGPPNEPPNYIAGHGWRHLTFPTVIVAGCLKNVTEV